MFHCRAAEKRDANFDVCRFSAARKTIKLFLKDSFPNMGERKSHNWYYEAALEVQFIVTLY